MNSGEVLSLTNNKARRPDLLKMLETVFPKGAAQSQPLKFEEEFEVLLTASNSKRILFIEEEGKIASALAWKPYQLKNGLKVACLGLVCTHPDFRKQGLSKKLIKKAEENAAEEHATLMCLWSDKVDYYMKQGYALSGSELSWDLSTANLNSESLGEETVRISPLSPDQGHMLSSLYSQDPLGPQRNLQSFEVQLRQSNSCAFFASHTAEQKRAYAVTGKGRDLRNVVHELIGSPELFETLLAKVTEHLLANSDLLKDYPPRLQFPYSHPHRPFLEDKLGAGNLGAVCFAKVLDLPRWTQAINTELHKQGLSELDIRLLPQEGELKPWGLYQKDECLFLSPDPAHSLQIFCHPWELSALEGLNKETLQALKNWDPYPIYFWGADSV